MIRPAAVIILFAVSNALAQAEPSASDPDYILGPAAFERTYNDPPGDVHVRRTDEAATFGPLNLPNTNLPDLRRVTLKGWAPDDPFADPYTGATTNNPDILRIDLLFDGLVNPPGTLGLGGFPYDPYRFGNNPLYGFIEIDVDNDINTGGELWEEAVYRFLGNTGRFAAIPNDATRTRVPIDVFQLAENNFFTEPFFERTGCDFTLKLCGCFNVAIAPGDLNNHDGDMLFEAGETMIVEGRFFQRASGYRDASAAFGGSDFGLYDPVVRLRFQHDTMTDQTLVSLVYPLTPYGAALLTGQPAQPIDLNVANHTSVQEALDDIIAGASGTLTGAAQVLTQNWAGDDPTSFLNPGAWRATAIVGTAYPDSRSPSLYVYTDIGFNARRPDINGDGIIDPSDRDLELLALSVLDGGAQDADLTVNNSVELLNFGLNFSLFDIDYDGFINGADVAFFPLPLIPGDINADGVVDTADLGILLGSFGDVGASPADINEDGIVDTADLGILLSNFGMSS
ncbi:MAG: hypothetical protein H6813_04770 [Phycisphaeraceae bacterium]|nr:hypothetical protein [Phycisphaeraceae bacterium]MCB9847263.1 hypothetical protein [Phycisphaeraceae bacterium]